MKLHEKKYNWWTIFLKSLMQCSDLKILKHLQITLSVLKYVQEDKNVFATILN